MAEDLDAMMYQTPEEQFRAIGKEAISGIKDQFPFEGKQQTLVLNKIWLGDKAKDPTPDPDDLKDAKVRARTLGVEIYGDLSVKDAATGQEKSRARQMKLATLPLPTGHYSFLVDGTEYQPHIQTRLKSGIFSRYRQNGSLESMANLRKGSNFNITLDPASGSFKMQSGTTNLPFYPIARMMGASDAQLESAWGKQLFDANKTDTKASHRAVKSLYNRVIYQGEHQGSSLSDHLKREEALRAYYKDTEMDADVNKRTLGAGYTNVSSGAMVDMSRKLLSISRGQGEVDDRDALHFKEMYGPEDRLKEKLSHYKTKREISGSILRHSKIDARNTPREIIGDTIARKIKNFFTSGTDFEATEENNPVNIISGYNKVTPIGEGGIGSLRAVPDATREVNDSHMGFLDPLHTPESNKVGVVLHTALGTKKRGRQLAAAAIDIKTGKDVELTPDKAENAVIAFPGQYSRARTGNLLPKGPIIKVMNKGKMDQVPAEKVDVTIKGAQNMFDVATNLIPFVGSTQGTRGMTASKMSEQALPLVGREAPRIQVASGEASGSSMEEIVGNKFSLSSPVAGRIAAIGDDGITVAAKNGKQIKVKMMENYPLNQKQFLHHEPIVKVGDEVQQGSTLADTNFTRNGVLALGRPMRVAFMPYKGHTLEDAGVISESAAKKLTSEHLYPIDVQVGDQSILNKSKYKAYFPNTIDSSQDAKLDNQGIIRKGMQVNPGEMLVAHVKKEEVTPDDTLLSRLHRSLSGPYKDRSATWDHDTPGTVTDVVNLGNRVRVFVKTQEPARLGDKIAGRYGNKSVITKILPDGEMPHTADGQPIDAIFDPHTVPSRINPSQIMEAAAGSAATAMGQTIKIQNFSGEDFLQTVKGWMKNAGLPESGKRDVLDPTSNKTIPGVFVGDHYVQKLKHKVDTKFAARNTEGYDVNEAPRKSKYGAQSIDNLTFYAMLAHGGNRAILREMATDHKSSRNPEVWQALQMGQTLPPPKPTFAYNKFLGYLSGMGVKVDTDQGGVSLSLMGDKDIEEMSGGVVSRPDLTIRGKDLLPNRNGIFDPNIFDGKDGWGHIDLARRIPNPLAKKAIAAVGHMKGQDFEDIMSGKKGVDRDGNIVPLSD